MDPRLETIVLSGECLLCIERSLQMFPGVLRITAGYVSDQLDPAALLPSTSTKNLPGHIHALQIGFDPKRITLPTIFATFATAQRLVLDRQQKNTQQTLATRPAIIFCTSAKEQEIAEDFVFNIQGAPESRLALIIKKFDHFHEVPLEQIPEGEPEHDTQGGDTSEEIKKQAQLYQESLVEFKNTKEAMLNLIEDAHLAEEREHKQAEEVKRFASIIDKERATYLLLLSSIGEGVLVVDQERKITIINDSAINIIGFTREDLVGKNLLETVQFTHKDGSLLEEELWQHVIENRTTEIFPNDVMVRNKKGALTPIACTVAPIIHSEKESPLGLIITFRDARKERELEEARVSFISIASHQLRTPLTSMRWFTEMILGGDAGPITEDQKHFMQRVYEGIDRMINLVNLLLQIARVEAGRIKITPTPIDLKTIANGVVLSLKTPLDEKEQKITIEANPDPLPLIPMEQEYVWQVIQNFLTNAIRYSPVGATIEIHIILEGDHLKLSVKDKGIGIPKEEQSRIFEKFFRAANAQRAVPEGSGLGLSLVKSLVEGWGGKLTFESEENVGTTFIITIPLAGMKPKEGELGLSVEHAAN